MELPHDIVRMVKAKEFVDRSAWGGLYPLTLPEVAASEDEILATERALGLRLDVEYRRFLRFANGWRSFHQYTDLFGTLQLLGAPNMPFARQVIKEFDALIFAAEFGVHPNDVLPIGVSDTGDLFLLVGANGKAISAGSVIWACPVGLVDQWANFSAFFLAMIGYTLALPLRDLPK